MKKKKLKNKTRWKRRKEFKIYKNCCSFTFHHQNMNNNWTFVRLNSIEILINNSPVKKQFAILSSFCSSFSSFSLSSQCSQYSQYSPPASSFNVVLLFEKELNFIFIFNLSSIKCPGWWVQGCLQPKFIIIIIIFYILLINDNNIECVEY